MKTSVKHSKKNNFRQKSVTHHHPCAALHFSSSGKSSKLNMFKKSVLMSTKSPLSKGLNYLLSKILTDCMKSFFITLLLRISKKTKSNNLV